MEDAKISDSTAGGHHSPLKGHWTAVTVALALLAGTASLLIFLTPAEIRDSFAVMNPTALSYSMVFFFLGLILSVERWRACLNYRGTWWESFHTLGVASAGNIFIPGRIGEALRVFLLARRGVGAEYGSSGLIQERLGDQMLRVVFIAVVILTLGLSSGQSLGSRMWAVCTATAAAFAALILVVRHRREVSREAGRWIGKLPRLTPEMVSGYVDRTLDDLAHSWEHPGSKMAVVWGTLAWLAFTVHTMYVLEPFFGHDTLIMSLLIMALTPATAPTHPGVYHGLCLAALGILGVERIPALQAAIVLHMIQMVVYTVWGLFGWWLLQRAHFRSLRSLSNRVG